MLVRLNKTTEFVKASDPNPFDPKRGYRAIAIVGTVFEVVDGDALGLAVKAQGEVMLKRDGDALFQPVEDFLVKLLISDLEIAD